MSAGHAHTLFLHGSGPLYRLPPQCKLAALVLFVLSVVATPPEAFWAFGVYLLMVGSMMALARIPVPTMARRMLIEVPFLFFALLLPVVGGGPRTDLLGWSLSVDGLWGAWNIVAKGSLGVMASIVVAATTPVADLLKGMDRLGVPAAFTAIAAFMVRYLDLIASELSRMRVALLSRAYDPRWLWQARPLAASAGALFVRSYERGERVYLAMQSRGYRGTMPDLGGRDATTAHWAAALGLSGLAALTAVLALVT